MLLTVCDSQLNMLNLTATTSTSNYHRVVFPEYQTGMNMGTESDFTPRKHCMVCLRPQDYGTANSLSGSVSAGSSNLKRTHATLSNAWEGKKCT